MNVYAMEVLNRFGRKMLNNMLEEFPEGFHIVGGDDLFITVGNEYKNTTFSRKTFKVKDTFSFEGVSKNSRKGVK